MEITKEYLDEQFKGINEKFKGIDEQFGKINQRFEKVDKRFDDVLLEIGKDMGRMETTIKAEIKASIAASEGRMQKFVIEGFTAHQTWVKEEFKEWIKPYDVATLNRVKQS